MRRLLGAIAFAMALFPCAAQAKRDVALPPQGLYNSCEIDTALSMCETRDEQMASGGFTLEINYIGLMAHKTGANSLATWLTYDASIGLRQVLNVKNAIKDADPLNGTLLVTSYATLATDCGASNNAQLISCVASVAGTSPAFYGWYIYDEPGCPDQHTGYCRGSLAGGNYANIATLAAYIASVDPLHPIIGINTPGGVPPCSGGWSSSCGPTQISDLYSWLTNSTTPYTGYDYYPIGFPGQSIADIGTIGTLLQNEIGATYPPEQVAFVAQAFSWYQESDSGCTIATCPYPTKAQLLQMRNQALYYANRAGNPLYALFYYEYADTVCLHNYSGCDATANWDNLVSAAFAPFPTQLPINVPMRRIRRAQAHPV
jgi:hypothetical protein